jgi:hypothetical protein
VARKAEEEAKRNLAEVQAKEQQRLEAQRKEEKARQELAEAYARLQATNGELSDALKQARIAQWRAKVSKKNADKNAETAKEAELRALRYAEDLRKKQEKDKERIALLESKLGGIIKVLE